MWYVVETLGPPEATVVWSAGRRVEWGSLKAVQRMHGVNAAPIVEAVRLSGEQHSGTLRGRNTLKRVFCEPTKGPDEAVHAVMLWVGAVDEMPSRAPSLGAMTWDVDTLVVQQTIECYMLSSETEEEFGATRDPALFLRKVFQFDHATELIELCFEPAKRSKFQGALTILHDDGHFMEWQGVAKYGQSEHLIRGFAQDLTVHEPPQLGPTLATRLPAMHLASTRSAAVLVSFPANPKNAPRIAYWLTQVPAALVGDTVFDSSYRFHDNDVADLRNLQALLGADASSQLAVEVRVHGRGHWVPCTLLCRRYPAENIGSSILVCELTVNEKAHS